MNISMSPSAFAGEHAHETERVWKQGRKRCRARHTKGVRDGGRYVYRGAEYARRGTPEASGSGCKPAGRSQSGPSVEIMVFSWHAVRDGW